MVDRDEARDFFDHLYQEWTKTSGAEDMFWRPESTEHGYVLVAEGRDSQRVIASGLSERDADWIAGIHGVFGDVVRRLHQALDEADQLERRWDEQQQELAL